MLTFGPPIEAGSSTATCAPTKTETNTRAAPTTTTSALANSRPPNPNPKRSSGLTPVEVRSMKEEIDNFLADIKNEGFTASTNHTFPALEDPFQHRRPITPPEPVHLGDLRPVSFLNPEALSENGMKPMGLGPANAPPVSYSTKPKVVEARSRSAEPPIRRTTLQPSEAWKRLGSSTYFFVEDERCVSR